MTIMTDVTKFTGSYFRGNVATISADLIADNVSTTWAPIADVLSFHPSMLSTLSMHTVSGRYLQFTNIAMLQARVSIAPSTRPYTGRDGDTTYVYTDQNPQITFTSLGDVDTPDQPLFTTLSLSLSPSLAVRTSKLFACTGSVTDIKGSVFLNPEVNMHNVAIVTADGRSATLSTGGTINIFYVNGFLPNHQYQIDFLLCYERNA